MGNVLIDTKAMGGLGAPLTLGVDLGTPLSTQTEGYSGFGVGLSFTYDKKLPFRSSRYVFQNDKSEDVFVSGLSWGLSQSLTLNLVRDATQAGPFGVAGEVPVELRLPVPLGSGALLVPYFSGKWSYSGAEAPPAPVEGVTVDPAAEVHLVPTATYGFALTAGAAFYLTPANADGAHVAGSPFFDINLAYAPQNFVDGFYTFRDVLTPDAEIPKTELSFTLQPPAAWTGKVAGFKFNYKVTSAYREVKDADGAVVPDYRDIDNSVTLTGALPFVRGSKVSLKLTRTWTDDVGEEFYHYGSGNAYGSTWGATATLKAPWTLIGSRDGTVSVDQALLEAEDRERLSDQVPLEFSLGYSQKEQTYWSDGLYLYSEDSPYLTDGVPTPYDGSGTPYDVAHLPNSDPSINDGMARTFTLGLKLTQPLGTGALTTTISLPFDVSPSAEGEEFFERFRDPTGNNHTIAIAYEGEFGGQSSRAAKTEDNSVATRVLQEWTSVIRDNLTYAKGKYKFSEDEVYQARDIVIAYMTTKKTNWADLQKEYDDLVADKDNDNSDLTMHDFIIILEWCNDEGRGMGAFKDTAKRKGLSLHDFAQEYKKEKDKKAAE